MRIPKPIVIISDSKTIDRLEDEYRNYMGYVTKRNYSGGTSQLTVYPRRNRNELG